MPGLGDRLSMGKPPRPRTRHPGLLSLSPPSVAGWDEYPAKAGGVNRYIKWSTSPYLWCHNVVLVPGCTGWLAEISANLQDLRRVCDDALYKSTVAFYSMYITTLVSFIFRCSRWLFDPYGPEQYFTSLFSGILPDRRFVNSYVPKAVLNSFTQNWASVSLNDVLVIAS